MTELTSTKIPSSEVQEAYLKLGMVLQQSGDHSEACRVLRRAIRRDPDSAAAHLALGMALMDRQNYREAVRVLRRAAFLAPPDDKETLGAAYSSLALAHLHLENPRAFLKAFQKARGCGGDPPNFGTCWEA